MFSCTGLIQSCGSVTSTLGSEHGMRPNVRTVNYEVGPWCNGVAPFVFHSFISPMSPLYSSCCLPDTVLSPADADVSNSQACLQRVQWGYQAGIQMITQQNELGLVIASHDTGPGVTSEFSFLPCFVKIGLLGRKVEPTPVGGPKTSIRFERWCLN